jgi:hypothetical protein
LSAWFVAFAVTVLVEVPVCLLLFRHDAAVGGWGRWKAIGILGCASLITHPFVWFSFPAWGNHFGWSYLETCLWAEAYAVSVEALYFSWWGLKRVWWVSLLANASSVAVGLTLRFFFGVP